MTTTSHAYFPTATLVTLAAAALTASLGISVASVLLPTLARSFSATVSEVQFVVLSYLLSVTVTIVTAGRLGDLFGHRKVLIAGLLIFMTASVLCAVAPTLNLLIAGRAVQGIGGAVLIALSMSLARQLIPTERLGTAMGLLGTTSAIGTALGPSLGGAILTLGNWQMAFWLLAAIAGGVFVLSVTVIERSDPPKGATFKDLDCLGTLLLMATLILYGFAASGKTSLLPISTNVLILGALITSVFFVIIERRATSPLVPMTLLKDRTTGTGFIMNIAVGTVMMSTLVVGPFFLSFSLELNEAVIGLVLAVGPAVTALSGFPAGRLTDRFGAFQIMIVGILQMIAGLLCLAFLPRYFGVYGYVGALIVLTPAFQMFLAANNTAVLAKASKDQQGRLSGLLGLSRNLGLMTGASAMSTLFVIVLGTGNAAQAPVNEVADAFSITFVLAAALTSTTLLIALFSRVGQNTRETK
ncbi:MAG: MFS transporter [Sneathiella sp.]|nr:MFS transporter [Sneathiella sp.]